MSKLAIVYRSYGEKCLVGLVPSRGRLTCSEGDKILSPDSWNCISCSGCPCGNAFVAENKIGACLGDSVIIKFLPLTLLIRFSLILAPFFLSYIIAGKEIVAVVSLLASILFDKYILRRSLPSYRLIRVLEK